MAAKTGTDNSPGNSGNTTNAVLVALIQAAASVLVAALHCRQEMAKVGQNTAWKLDPAVDEAAAFLRQHYLGNPPDDD